MKIGYIGLGKMGFNMAVRLKKKGHSVVAYNRSEEPRRRIARAGVPTASSIPHLIGLLKRPRIVWIMVSHSAVDPILEELLPYMEKEDILIDGGNCFYEDTLRRAKMISARGIRFLDIGVSGGPGGAKNGACLMVGGDKTSYKKILPIIRSAAAPNAYAFLGGHGAGHFTKMVHNGIEYGMMQALAEGFSILKGSAFSLDLTTVAKLYNNKSVIESRLVEWLVGGFKTFGTDLKDVSGTVAHTGEGAWTVETARKLGIPAPVIETSLEYRRRSAEHPDFTGKILSALRNQFGGHDISHT